VLENLFVLVNKKEKKLIKPTPWFVGMTKLASFTYFLN
jgi:hypothetical protein